MNKALRFFLFIILSRLVVCGYAQTLTVTGTVSSTGKLQADALVDVYEYNSPIQTLHTDASGKFSFEMARGKEYLVVVYKSGYVMQSYSISDSRPAASGTFALTTDLAADSHSPEGLYFKAPLRRISPEIDLKTLRESKFDLTQIKPQHRADSVLVLLNRAQANQYILVSKMHLGAARTDDKYSKQVEENIKAEMNNYAAQVIQSNARYDEVKQDEEKHVAASLKTKDDEQYNHLVLAQKDLADRLAERSSFFLLSQQKQLAKARLLELNAIRYDEMGAGELDSARKAELKDNYWQMKAQATNARYLAMDANAKFLWYNKYQMLNYQEYIEMLNYKERKADATKTAAAPVKKGPPVRSATISVRDTSDNLSKMNDTSRAKLIQAALEEEERFKNYNSKTEVKKIDGNDMTVQTILIADDHYEMQTDSKGAARYYKNNKPVTKLTFEFETKRKMVDVLNTIRDVDKFGR